MGSMIEFDSAGTPAPGYLATPNAATGSEAPGVLVLHAWWGLTEPFRQVCDRLAEAGFVALAPDLYRGKTTAKIEEAEALATALNQEQERVEADIAGAVRFLNERAASSAGSASGLGVTGFSLGGAYAFDMSVSAPDQVAAVVTFYATYTGLEYRDARATYLCHFAEHDPFEPEESVAELEQELRSAGKQFTFHTYPGTTHWFFEANRPDAYNADAARLAWERTVAFLNERLRQP
ncbi:MAG TPA: dienelactone hydrolase family protein [Ktedonobacterales bacterium]|nr:dienelactone hydrolase family protein [Ktedonobacterales bacterium]